MPLIARASDYCKIDYAYYFTIITTTATAAAAAIVSHKINKGLFASSDGHLTIILVPTLAQQYIF